MWRIYQFLIRWGNVILFLSLEFVSLMLIINLNKPHKDISQSFFQEFSGGISNISSSIQGYFNLSSENRKLQEQNVKLMSQVVDMENNLDAYRYKVPLQRKFTLLPDSVFPTEKFNFLPCRAINNSVNRNYNYITINKGYNQGVRANMGVLSPEGVVGRVVNVSKNYSLALSVLNKKFKLSAKMKHNDNLGTLSWNGGSPEYGILEFIPQTSEVTKGDTVTTSGHSTLFPQDFMIGVVEDYDTKEQLGFFRIRVKLATNFRALDNLYLVSHEDVAEIDSLESLIKEK